MNDEHRMLIAAYVDGELDAVSRRAARKLADSDPDARAFLESLEHLNDRMKAAFGPVADEPVPAALLAGIDQATLRRRSHFFVPLALAASVVLVAVLAVRQHEIDQQVNHSLAAIQQQMLQLRQETLENVPSGRSASWAEPAGMARIEVTPVKTYRTADNGFCREFKERIEDAGGVETRRGIACRTGKAEWPEQSSVVIPKRAAGGGTNF